MKRLTNEEFIRRVSFANSDVEILDEYINCKTKVHCRCKICEYMWYGLPSNLLRGVGCKKCSDKRLEKTKKNSHERFIDKLKSVNPNVEILSQYNGYHKKGKCRWKIDCCEGEATPANL